MIIRSSSPHFVSKNSKTTARLLTDLPFQRLNLDADGYQCVTSRPAVLSWHASMMKKLVAPQITFWWRIAISVSQERNDRLTATSAAQNCCVSDNGHKRSITACAILKQWYNTKTMRRSTSIVVSDVDIRSVSTRSLKERHWINTFVISTNLAFLFG